MKPKWGLSPYMLINLSCTLNMLRYISSKIEGTKIYIQFSRCMIMYFELKVKQMFFLQTDKRTTLSLKIKFTWTSTLKGLCQSVLITIVWCVFINSNDVESIKFEVTEGRKKNILKRPIRMSTIFRFVQGHSLLARPHNI